MTPKQVLEKWIDAFNKGDTEAISSLYADSATNHQVANEPVIGKEAIRQMFTRWRGFIIRVNGVEGFLIPL